MFAEIFYPRLRTWRSGKTTTCRWTNKKQTKNRHKQSKSGENPLKKFRAQDVRCTPRLCLQVSMECAFAKQQSMVFALIEKTEPFFRICFVKLKLLLVAIEVKDEEANDDTEISINPRQAKTPGNTIGYFWAQSAEEVKRWVNNNDR